MSQSGGPGAPGQPPRAARLAVGSPATRPARGLAAAPQRPRPPGSRRRPAPRRAGRRRRPSAPSHRRRWQPPPRAGCPGSWQSAPAAAHPAARPPASWQLGAQGARSRPNVPPPPPPSGPRTSPRRRPRRAPRASSTPTSPTAIDRVHHRRHRRWASSALVVALVIGGRGRRRLTTSDHERHQRRTNYARARPWSSAHLVISAAYFVWMWSAQRATVGMQRAGPPDRRRGRRPVDHAASRRSSAWLIIGIPLILSRVRGLRSRGRWALLGLVGFIWLIALLCSIAQSPTKQGYPRQVRPHDHGQVRAPRRLTRSARRSTRPRPSGRGRRLSGAGGSRRTSSVHRPSTAGRRCGRRRAADRHTRG